MLLLCLCTFPSTDRRFEDRFIFLICFFFCRHLARSDSPRSLLPLIHHIISLNRATLPCSAMALPRCPRSPPSGSQHQVNDDDHEAACCSCSTLRLINHIYLHASCGGLPYHLVPMRSASAPFSRSNDHHHHPLRGVHCSVVWSCRRLYPF